MVEFHECEGCGEVLGPNEGLINDSGTLYCEECYEEDPFYDDNENDTMEDGYA